MTLIFGSIHQHCVDGCLSLPCKEHAHIQVQVCQSVCVSLHFGLPSKLKVWLSDGRRHCLSNGLTCPCLCCSALTGRSISYNNHAKLVRDVLKALSILVEKVTHLSRIFAAQLLIAMGLRVEDVQRAGGWLKDCLGTAYIIISLSPEALLALAMWRKDGADFQCFADPRFHIAVPDELLYHAMPALKTFREKADAAVAAAVADGAPADLKGPAMIASQMARVMTVALVHASRMRLLLQTPTPKTPSTST